MMPIQRSKKEKFAGGRFWSDFTSDRPRFVNTFRSQSDATKD